MQGTNIHFVHGLTVFLMVVWFFMLTTLLMARYPDNGLVQTLREIMPHGDLAGTEQSTVQLKVAA